jgi:hypothetical protein
MMDRGYHVTRLLGPRAQATLTQEAVRCQITESYLEQSPDEDVRRGNPARRLHTAVGGGALRALYASAMLGSLLRRITGAEWTPSAQLGTYSIYCRPGHYLDLHRDVDTCDLAVIACLYEHGAPTDGSAGALCLWPERRHEPLAALRADPGRGRVIVRLAPGEAIVLAGGVVPHAIAPLGEAHTRIVAPLCFRPAR